MEISKSTIHGVGVFSDADYPVGTYFKAERGSKSCPVHSNFLPPFKYLNSSEDPNLKVDVKQNCCSDCILGWISIKPIKKGDELTFNYESGDSFEECTCDEETRTL